MKGHLPSFPYPTIIILPYSTPCVLFKKKPTVSTEQPLIVGTTVEPLSSLKTALSMSLTTVTSIRVHVHVLAQNYDCLPILSLVNKIKEVCKNMN